WRCHMRLEKFNRDGNLYETIEEEGNLLTTNGANALFTLLTGGGGTTFANANAYLGGGDSSTAEAVGQTDLQAYTNKTRKAVASGRSPAVSTNTVQFQSTFGTADANYAWNEWGTFNASSGGTMLNRKVVNMGTKSSSATWTLTVTLSLA